MTDFPRKLNLGSGKDFRDDCFNVDISPMWSPDLVWDISQSLPDIIRTDRHGILAPLENYFDEIIANDVLEHIPNLVSAMTNCLHILRVGGVMNICVPYDLSYGAWQDPTHVRAFNERSWIYYTDWWWYLGWKTHKFALKNLEFLLENGAQPRQDNDYLPREVAAMKVIMEKIELTEEERKYGESFYVR